MWPPDLPLMNARPGAAPVSPAGRLWPAPQPAPDLSARCSPAILGPPHCQCSLAAQCALERIEDRKDRGREIDYVGKNLSFYWPVSYLDSWSVGISCDSVKHVLTKLTQSKWGQNRDSTWLYDSGSWIKLTFKDISCQFFTRHDEKYKYFSILLF